MGSQTAFGPRGAATVLSKATTTAAVVFMLTSITLGIWQGRNVVGGQSVIDRSGLGSESAPESEEAAARKSPLRECPPAPQRSRTETTGSRVWTAESGWKPRARAAKPELRRWRNLADALA